MHRSKLDILKAMNPAKPETIQALIDFHRRAAGGFVMVDDPAKVDPPKVDPPKVDPPKVDPPKVDPDDEALGAAGLKALQTERDARKALETQLADLKSKQIDPKKLAEALGLEVPKDAKSTGEEILTGLQQQLADMKHETALYRIAAKHSITDADDIEILKGVKDEAAMEKLATRLAKKVDAPPVDPKKPKVDKSQHRGAGDGGKATSVQQVMAERRAAREKANSTT